jgi:hypothetical protein
LGIARLKFIGCGNRCPNKFSRAPQAKSVTHDVHSSADLSPEKWQADGKHAFSLARQISRKCLRIKVADSRIRTDDLLITNQLLYQLSYAGLYDGKLRRRERSKLCSTASPVNQWKRAKTWERTWLQNLVRHKSGRYYARAFAGGKEVWKSLKTSHFSVAEARLAEFLKEHRKRVSNGNGEVSAKMTFGEAAAIHLRNLDDNVRIKPRTRHYWLQRLAALIKSWPGLNETEIRKITHTDCKKWACMYAKNCVADQL